MITKYLEEALKRASYQPLEGGGYCATVRGLRGVLLGSETQKVLAGIKVPVLVLR